MVFSEHKAGEALILLMAPEVAKMLSVGLERDLPVGGVLRGDEGSLGRQAQHPASRGGEVEERL